MTATLVALAKRSSNGSGDGSNGSGMAEAGDRSDRTTSWVKFK